VEQFMNVGGAANVDGGVAVSVCVLPCSLVFPQ
jgi:hypothetical protein